MVLDHAPDPLYDVVIMGGGYAGLVQALHLHRTIPGVSMVIVEPRTDEEIAAICKVGESTVEIAANFMVRDLGLADYLAGTCPPKYGLNFHWPKDLAMTDSVDDYFSSWVPQGPTIPSYQLHRGRFEKDVTKMVRALGIPFVRAKVDDFEIGVDGAHHRIETLDSDGNRRSLRGKHLVDCGGRIFLIAQKRGILRRDPKDLWGLDTVSAWIRVKGVDPSIIEADSHSRRSSVSGYFATNHWFGDGHWVWTIPIDGNEGILSIGIVAHKQRIPLKDINSEEKLFAFLKEKHRVIYDIAKSGEVEDFRLAVRPAFTCTEMLGEDNWYLVGDAAYFGDPFYSMGTSSIAITVTSVTEVIRSRLAGEPTAEANRAEFDEFNRGWANVVIHVVRDHYKHLGNASAMSWRIYFEYIWWFGLWVPMFIGRWHLEPKFLKLIQPTGQLPLVQSVYEDLTEMVEAGVHAGFADPYRSDLFRTHFAPPKKDHVDFLDDAAYQPQRLNIYRALTMTLRYSARWLLKFQYRAWGWRGLVKVHTWTRWFNWMGRSMLTSMLALRHDLMMKRGAKGPSASERFDMEFETYRPPVMSSKPPEKRAGPKKDAAA
jgi:flavin-dependent dehydrogenase